MAVSCMRCVVYWKRAGLGVHESFGLQLSNNGHKVCRNLSATLYMLVYSVVGSVTREVLDFTFIAVCVGEGEAMTAVLCCCVKHLLIGV